MPIQASVEEILAKLDDMSLNGLWPTFDGPLGTFEYHAMRMIAVTERGGDEDWGLAFECVLGDFLDEPGVFNAYAASVSTYTLIPSNPWGQRDSRELLLTLVDDESRDHASLHIEGIVVNGPAGELRCTDAMLADLDLRPGMLCGGCDGGATDSNLVLLIRAYLARFPGSFWQDDTVVASFGGPCDVVVVSDAFEHVVGRGERNLEAGPNPFAIAPSESPTYRSLAEALVTGDPTRFVPGVSNLDWRRWATIRDANGR